MKKLLSFILMWLFVIGSSSAQESALPALDNSPMDMSYFPVNYPILKIQNKVETALLARVIYSRPKKNGRTVFGQLVEFGTVWRLGANEATEVEFYKHVKINGKKINKGRYTLYAIVNENSWTIILNSETDIWGSFKYNVKKDVVRVDVPVQKTKDVIEALAMCFAKTSTGITLLIGWDNVRVALPISH